MVELVDVLLWGRSKNFIEYCDELDKCYHDDPVEYMKKYYKYIFDDVKTKANFIKRVDDYSEHGGAIWQEQVAQHCDMLNSNALIKALQFGTKENGERRFLSYNEMVKTWAYHLPDYARSINNDDNTQILELATGAGLGTCAVINELLPNNRLISVDIDFVAARNADGLAQYFNVSDRVCGLNANFWFLPFTDCVFDTVCTHYGLDESREIPNVIKEVSRVLKQNGRFIVIARKTPYDRHKNIMGMFDITEKECNPLLEKARLYGGFIALTECAAKYGLFLTEHKTYEPETSHHRIMYVFQKKRM